MANDDTVKQAYAEWLLLSKDERDRLGLPTSQAAYARHIDVTSKTLTRWKEDPVVLAVLHRDEEDLPAVEGGLDKLQADLLSKALKGGEKAIEQYMKWFGKEELEAARRSSQVEIRDMTDEELIASILNMIGRESVEAWLEAQRVGA